MKIIKEPNVYFIAEQSINENELQRFYNDENLEYYLPESCSQGEALIELCGRIDYK